MMLKGHAMATVGDLRIIDAWEDSEGLISVVFRRTDEVWASDQTRGDLDDRAVLAKQGAIKSSTEYIRSATPDELATAGVDAGDPTAVAAYLGRDLVPVAAPTKRTDLVVPVTADLIASKEAERMAALEIAAESVDAVQENQVDETVLRKRG